MSRFIIWNLEIILCDHLLQIYQWFCAYVNVSDISLVSAVI